MPKELQGLPQIRDVSWNTVVGDGITGYCSDFSALANAASSLVRNGYRYVGKTSGSFELLLPELYVCVDCDSQVASHMDGKAIDDAGRLCEFCAASLCVSIGARVLKQYRVTFRMGGQDLTADDLKNHEVPRRIYLLLK